MPCRYSSNRFPAFIFAWICLPLNVFCAPVLAHNTSVASGSAANMLTAILQSIQTNEAKANTGITTAPINWGKWCEIPVSAIMKSVTSMEDKSPGSRLDRKPSESFLRCSASDKRPEALISYAPLKLAR